jgi:undecaprenyl-diphosphatase
MQQQGPRYDQPILTFWHRHATPVLDAVAVALTIVGNTWPMVGTAVAVLVGGLLKGERRLAWVFAVSVGGSMLLTQVIKALVQRARPALWSSIRPAQTFSFPSGHAMDTAAIAVALGFLLWQWRGRLWGWGLAVLFALGVGWARLYLGVHYPSDVLAGWVSAVGWVVGVQLWLGPRPSNNELIPRH